MAFSTGTSTQQSEINVTPLIDVLLVLLIIFMVIVPVAPRGLESQIPQDSKAVQPAASPVSLLLLGDESGDSVRYEVDGRMVEQSQLEQALLEALRVRSERGVYLEASPGVSYKLAAEAVAAAKEAGATAVGLGRIPKDATPERATP